MQRRRLKANLLVVAKYDCQCKLALEQDNPSSKVYTKQIVFTIEFTAMMN